MITSAGVPWLNDRRGGLKKIIIMDQSWIIWQLSIGTIIKDFKSSSRITSLKTQYTPSNVFRRRFQIRRSLFLQILDGVEAYDDYFVQKPNAAGKLEISSLQKVTLAIRMIACGTFADTNNEYLRMLETTSWEWLRWFSLAIIAIFKSEYMRYPTQLDLERILARSEQQGFPGMLGSLDCMHWVWKNCPRAWHGQYTGKEKEPTIILEVVASHDLWFWHAFFGLPESHNDINLLNSSPPFK